MIALAWFVCVYCYKGRGEDKPPHQPPNEPDRCSATDETQA